MALFGRKRAGQPKGQPPRGAPVDDGLVLEAEPADGEPLFCSACGRQLGFDPEDEPSGDGPGRHLCGECNRQRNFDAELEWMWRNGDL